ncbi:MAG TPA: helix-turn-helix transcriptional regulator [Candidatus Limnocylindria bacterium]
MSARGVLWLVLGGFVGWSWARGVLESRAASDGLTDRQAEILTLVASGMSSKEIALHTGISEHSVNTHIRRATRTLGVGTRAAAAAVVTRKRRQAGTPARPRRSATPSSAVTTSATSSSNGT